MAQSSRLLDYVESYSIAGLLKTKIYTELNTNFKLNEKIYIVGGNYDNYSLGIGISNPYSEFAMGYKIIALDNTQNWIVIDREYDGTSLYSSPTDDVLISKGYFRQGEFNNGSFNDGIFGNATNPLSCLFNNKHDNLGVYELLADINHCIWINGIWQGGEWKSKTDNFLGSFKTIKATLNNNSISINTLSGIDSNNYNYGYNLWIDGTWIDGNWFNGTWEAGDWMIGNYHFGIFKSGNWFNGIKIDGLHTSLNGLTNWFNGTHENGSMNDCLWKDGIWENGNWNGANNFKILNILTPITAPYDSSGTHASIILDDTDFLNIFSIGDEIMLSYINISSSFDNNFNMETFVIQDITVNNEIIINSSIPVSMDLSLARISNSRWIHGLWNNGNWNGGYRRAGVKIDFLTLDDSIANQIIVEIIDPSFWSGSVVTPDYGLIIGQNILLTNLTDSLNNKSENYPLEISGIIPGSPTTVVLINAPITWQNDLTQVNTINGNYIDNTIWENGNFNSGLWENGYFKLGDVYADVNNTINDYYTIWRNGEWSKKRYSVLIDYSTWNNGVWKNGVFENGEWNNGVWENGLWKSLYEEFPSSSFTNYSAFWNNGTWENGTWETGVWNNGVWNNGSWLAGATYSITNGIFFTFPKSKNINGVDYLGFQFNSLTPLSNIPEVGNSFRIDNTMSYAFGPATPIVLNDPDGNQVTGTTYTIIDIEEDLLNNWLFIYVDSSLINLPVLNFQYSGDISIGLDSINIFNDGNFLGGLWDNGIFNNGIFSVANWTNGTFNNGTFDTANWTNGIFNNGSFNTSNWTNGTFNNGNFISSLWTDGTFNNGLMDASTFTNGTWNDGLISNTSILNGSFYGGESDNNIMTNGNIYDDHIFKNSTMNNGIMYGGFFDSSVKNNGTIEGGIINGTSIHNGGDLLGGEWLNGTWDDGNWNSTNFIATNFNYTNLVPGTTSVTVYNKIAGNILQNGDFASGGALWAWDPEWTITSEATAVSLSSVLPGSYSTDLTQFSINGTTATDGYVIGFNIISNTHPNYGLPGGSAINDMIIILGVNSSFVIDTSPGYKEVYIASGGPGGTLDLIFRVLFEKTSLIEHNITIDNITIETIVNGGTSQSSIFNFGDEIYNLGFSYNLVVTEPIVELNQKGIITNNWPGILTFDLIGDLLLYRTLPVQVSRNIYISNSIWRDGNAVGGIFNGILYKNGIINHTIINDSVIENVITNNDDKILLTSPGLDFQSYTGWSGSNIWNVENGYAECVPGSGSLTYNNLLTAGKYYEVEFTLDSNTNHLETTLSFNLGSTKYQIGSTKPGKTYKITGLASYTYFNFTVASNNVLDNSKYLKITNFSIKEVKNSIITNSTWINGINNGSSIINSKWINGEFNDGVFVDSTWINGTCNYGNFFNSIWENGVFNDGIWDSDDVDFGLWSSGTWNDGTFKKGTVFCIDWSQGIWENGVFRDGKIYGNSKVIDGLFVSGDLKIRNYSSKIFNTSNVSIDSVGDKITIKNIINDNLQYNIEASEDYSLNRYPSGNYDAPHWGTWSPGWKSLLRPTADWNLDDQKIIIRDLLDYHLNSSGNYSDLWDVDFVTGSAIPSDLSGDGMVTSTNTQTSDWLRLTKKVYEDNDLLHTGDSNLTNGVFISPGKSGIHWSGGEWLGGLTTSKISGAILFNQALNAGGFIELKISGNYAAYFNPGVEFYMYGSGEFNNNTADSYNKDKHYKVTSSTFDGTSTLVLTTESATGVALAFFPFISVEIWISAIQTNKQIFTTAISIIKTGRYVTYVLTGDHTQNINKNNTIIFNSINDATTLLSITSKKEYTVKEVNYTGVNTNVILMIKKNNMTTGSFSDNVDYIVIENPEDGTSSCI